MKAVLRVDASSTIGSGHLSRCLTLARSLVRAGFDVAIATRDGSEHTKKWVDREAHRRVAIDGEEIAASRRAAEGAALVVVDGYGFGADLHDALRAPGRVVCVIDDTGERPVRGDVVLNGNFFGASVAYDGVAHRLVGPAYGLVREEFALARLRRESALTGPAQGSLPRLLVSMGGADPASATERFLEALPLVGPAYVQLVVGGANPRAAEIRALASRVPGHRIEVLVDVARMSELMLTADLAVVAAGSTCLELACVGIAAVVVAVADNQVPVAEAVAALGLMRSVGRIEAAGPADFAAAVQGLLADPAARRTAEEAQRSAVDGRGAERAAAALRQLV